MSRSKFKPEDLIAAIYEEEGFYEVKREEEGILGASSRLVLSDGDREIVVNILDEDTIMIHGALQEALLQAEKLRERYDGVIIAIPRRFRKAIDEGVLSFHGFGLMIYDKLGAEEIISPRLAEKGTDKSHEVDQVESMNLQEIVRLRSEIARILRMLEELEAKLDRLEKEHRSLDMRVRGIEGRLREEREKVSGEPAERRVKPISASEKLPSYLVGNPWIKILSRRE